MTRFAHAWRRLQEAACLPFSYVGRRRLVNSLRFRLWPILFPVAHLLRRTLLRRVRLIVVIGSFGKTTTTRAILAALGGDPEQVRGWNAGGMLAEAVFRIRPTDPLAVIEVGIGSKGQMARYARVLRPDTVVVTSIGREHHRTLGSLNDIRQEKAAMLRSLRPNGVAILNRDDPNVRWMGSQTVARVLTYGFDPAADLSATEYRSNGVDGSHIVVRSPEGTQQLRLQLIGRHMVASALAGLAVACTESTDLAAAATRLADLAPTPHRLCPVRLTSGGTFLMDDYKAVLETIHVAIRSLSVIPARRRLLVLGEVFEPPGSDSEVYGALGRLASSSADAILFVGPARAFNSLREGVRGMGSQGPTLFDAQESVHRVADALVRECLKREDVILVKGIGYQRLERIPLLLDGVTVRCTRTICRAPITLACRDCPEL